MSAAGLPLRVRFKPHKGCDPPIYLARDVVVMCGEQEVSGVVRVRVKFGPRGIAVIDMRMQATIEVDNDNAKPN